ncbi:ABC transporter type 1, transmembrane domain-containing protein [Flammula alnicola]|nr:ABC transporter type 1, transmembrane domain-containing protein [Flammula alnicola]
MGICGDHGPLDLHSSCIRSAWSAFLPAALVFTLCFFSIPVPRPARRLVAFLGTPFKPFLSLPEAEALNLQALGKDHGSDNEDTHVLLERPIPVSRWRTIVFVLVGTAQCLCWVAIASYCLYKGPSYVWGGIFSFLVAISWIYTVIRPIAHPTATPPYDLFVLYLILFATAVFQLGGVIFDRSVFGIPFPSSLAIVGLVGNLVSVFILLCVTVTMPMGYPSSSVNPKHIGHSISPEDYTTLWGWITFRWIDPLIRLGKHTTLHEKDVWNLSPTMQSRPIFAKFSSIHRSTLLRRIVAANSFDLIFDFVLTLASVIFNYAGPFFLKHILEAIERENSSKESRARAYVYAFLALVCSLLKAQADAQHLWLGRRASIWLRLEIMAAIYDKALKRKDFSGIVSKDQKEGGKSSSSNGTGKAQTKAQKKAEKDKAAKADDPKAGADVGKIVNLMAGDASRLARTVSTVHIIYAAPFEILIASTFLYQLLGLSAFAGFVVLLVAWPLNSFLMRRGVRIQKGLLSARDKRMGVLNELIGAIKFIKFFAWEERWIGRALDAREVEMKWMIKARVNSVVFNLLWSCAPVLVSIIAFFTYVMTGHQLTISTAFTAITLFNMVKSPLNVIPAWMVQILQTGVALKRISVYLEEDEVTEQVSSLKKSNPDRYHAGIEDEGLGLDNATFKWNEVTETGANAKGKRKDSPSTAATSSDDASTIAEDDSSDESANERGTRAFMLKDVSVVFPEGELTVVTGPTASGKTALLMAVLGEMTLVNGRIIMSKEPSRVDEHGLMHCISYAAQTPWLCHQSIKENILVLAGHHFAWQYGSFPF